MNKTFIFIALFILQSILLPAQDIEKPILTWGIQAKLGTETVSHISSNEEIFTYRKMPLLFGAFAKYKKFETDIDFSLWYFNGNLRYQLFPNIWLGAAAGVSKHTIEIDHSSSGDSYSYVYTEGDVNYYKYTFNIGYGKVFFNRLDFRADVSLGSLNSNTGYASDEIYSYYYSTNKRARKNDTYKLNPSFIYGTEISLALLPNPNRHRRFPVAPFFTLSFMGKGTSNITRTVNIEEWIPGNIVYSETSDQSSINYDLFSFKGQAGIRWYFNH